MAVLGVLNFKFHKKCILKRLTSLIGVYVLF
jgi:hypothetical protein